LFQGGKKTKPHRFPVGKEKGGRKEPRKRGGEWRDSGPSYAEKTTISSTVRGLARSRGRTARGREIDMFRELRTRALLSQWGGEKNNCPLRVNFGVKPDVLRGKSEKKERSSRKAR